MRRFSGSMKNYLVGNIFKTSEKAILEVIFDKTKFLEGGRGK